jgi:hypothetical protein
MQEPTAAHCPPTQRSRLGAPVGALAQEPPHDLMQARGRRSAIRPWVLRGQPLHAP